VKLAELREHFLGIANVPPRLVLRENQLAVRSYVEDSPVARNELGLDPELFLDCFRQTGGNGIVVSDFAEFDRDVQQRLLGEDYPPGRSGREDDASSAT
jgi:hypothetical protein